MMLWLAGSTFELVILQLELAHILMDCNNYTNIFTINNLGNYCEDITCRNASYTLSLSITKGSYTHSNYCGQLAQLKKQQMDAEL
ncbi:unnamed protein product [Paramecium sonneborni]|uniref:Secreted protein n=1 Tax=Paramecium sonneborni TaxID=65129 RepID=A0A8S1LG17_9CILI|nr:unnamed protein product [Paramecium sonneborni]